MNKDLDKMIKEMTDILLRTHNDPDYDAIDTLERVCNYIKENKHLIDNKGE